MLAQERKRGNQTAEKGTHPDQGRRKPGPEKTKHNMVTAHSSQHAGREAADPEPGLGGNGEAHGNFKMIVTHFRI